MKNNISNKVKCKENLNTLTVQIVIIRYKNTNFLLDDIASELFKTHHCNFKINHLTTSIFSDYKKKELLALF